MCFFNTSSPWQPRANGAHHQEVRRHPNPTSLHARTCTSAPIRPSLEQAPSSSSTRRLHSHRRPATALDALRAPAPPLLPNTRQRRGAVEPSGPLGDEQRASARAPPATSMSPPLFQECGSVGLTGKVTSTPCEYVRLQCAPPNAGARSPQEVGHRPIHAVQIPMFPACMGLSANVAKTRPNDSICFEHVSVAALCHER